MRLNRFLVSMILAAFAHQAKALDPACEVTVSDLHNGNRTIAQQLIPIRSEEGLTVSVEGFQLAAVLQPQQYPNVPQAIEIKVSKSGYRATTEMPGRSGSVQLITPDGISASFICQR